MVVVSPKGVGLLSCNKRFSPTSLAWLGSGGGEAEVVSLQRKALYD